MSRFLFVCTTLSLAACSVDYSQDHDLDDRGVDAEKEWDDRNDPVKFNVDYEYRLAELPESGGVSKEPWAGSYWPYYKDSINEPVHTGAPEDENAPSKRYAKAFDKPEVPELVSKDKGVLAMKARGKAECTVENQKDTCTDKGDVCAIREGEETGYCSPTWWGICHAWAPASVLLAEPKVSVEHNGVTFDPNDIKALVSMTWDDGVVTHFLAGRCNKDEGDEEADLTTSECEDVNAGSFHVIAANELGIRHKGFVEDRTWDDEVWNQPVRDFDVRKLEAITEAKAQELTGGEGDDYTPNPDAVTFYDVRTTLRYVSESSSSTMGWLGDRLDNYTHSDTYTYVLELDADGKIIGGEWTGTSVKSHPDFLWMPLNKFEGVTNGIDGNDVKMLLEKSNGTYDADDTDTDDGGFDWGGVCDSGDGEFEQNIPHRDIVEIGKIPAGKSNVMIFLNAGTTDVDVQLWDGKKSIVRWASNGNHGMLNGSSRQSVTYNGVKYTYSGYNGNEGKKGDEYILIEGTTNSELTMKAFGYEAGNAPVTYRYEAPRDCIDAGEGTFNQPIEKDAIVDVGTVPVGKSNLRIELTSDKDVDIQLYDNATETAIVRWAATSTDAGLINGAGKESVEYKGMTITYSGYNGDGTNYGHEYITVEGAVTTELKMTAFGYAAGDAFVEYAWGMDSGELNNELDL
jgi:hypothetical protein